MGEVKGYPRALLDQACCIGLIGKNVIIDCETRAEAEEVLDWLCDGRAAETTAQAEIERLTKALEATRVHCPQCEGEGQYLFGPRRNQNMVPCEFCENARAALSGSQT